MADPSIGRPWRPAPVLASLRTEIDRGWPNRSTSSDGFLGDELHKLRHSHHNPNQNGYVTAWDVTNDAHNGPPLFLLAAFLRDVGRHGSQRLNPGGYVIFDRKICSAGSEWEWIHYGGKDPHVGHLHVSCAQLEPFYKITRVWNVVEEIRKRAERFR